MAESSSFGFPSDMVTILLAYLTNALSWSNFAVVSAPSRPRVTSVPPLAPILLSTKDLTSLRLLVNRRTLVESEKVTIAIFAPLSASSIFSLDFFAASRSLYLGLRWASRHAPRVIQDEHDGVVRNWLGLNLCLLSTSLRGKSDATRQEKREEHRQRSEGLANDTFASHMNRPFPTLPADWKTT